MPRINYGNAVKQRTLQLLTILVDYANDEIDLADRLWENFQRQIQLQWQTDRRLVVRTKIRHLEELVKAAGTDLSGDEIKESIARAMDFLGIIEDNRPTRGGSENWHFTLNLWHSRFDRSANLERFDLEWIAKKLGDNRVAVSPSIDPNIEIDRWFDLVKNTLQQQEYQRVTTNALMVGTRMTFDLDRLYIPMLGSIDRGSNTAAEDTSTVIDPDRFFEKFISDESRQRLGIIGEPGAGKTTLLQRWATKLIDRQLLPIWVSCADLAGDSLETYLLDRWLKMATKSIEVEAKTKQELVARFRTGKVWLLLDAIDESSSHSHSQILAHLAREFQGWLGEAHIIITCRAHVWEGHKNPLENFTIYRNLGFSYPEWVGDRNIELDRRQQFTLKNQINSFIERWFTDRPEAAQKAINAISLNHHYRLRDAVKNPLRLALLCHYLALDRGDLPTTKSGLYRQFVEHIYEWKQDRFPTSITQRYQLNIALGKLALAAHQKADIGWRLPHSFILSIVSPELLELALQIGWLHQVGIGLSWDERVYAFYHPTFQEYFAAAAIDTSNIFTTIDALSGNSPIFMASWREVIIFWCGRSDIHKEDKISFLDYLLDFPKTYAEIYYHRAHFLAAACLSQFNIYPRAKQLIQQLLKWRFAEYIPALGIWQYYPAPIQTGAQSALRQTDLNLATQCLIEFVTTVNNPYTRWQSAYSLGKIFDPGNQTAINALADLIPHITDDRVAIKVCESLGKIDRSNQIAIDCLTRIINTSVGHNNQRKAAFVLAKIDPDNILALDTLLSIARADVHPDICLSARKNLHQLAPKLAIDLPLTKSKSTPPSSARPRRKPSPARDLSVQIAEITDRLLRANDDEALRRLAERLGTLDRGNDLAINTLLELLTTDRSDRFYKNTSESIQAILSEKHFTQIIPHIKPHALPVTSYDRSPRAIECYKILWYCAERLSYWQFTEAFDR